MGIIKSRTTVCPTCANIIPRKDKYCDECKADMKAELMGVIKRKNYGSTTAIDRYYTAGLIELVAHEIHEEAHEQLLEKFEKERKNV